MPFILEYSIKFSISLAMIYLFYATVLRKLTFYHWNRWYLLVYSSMAFLIALIDISPFVYKNQLETSQVIQIIPLFDSYKASNKSLTIDNWGFWDWTLLLFVIGAVIMFLRMGIQYFSINRIRSKAKLLLDAPVKVYQVDASIMPFSFGKSIFINQELHSEEELKEIIRHEFIHIRQLHTVDMIWGEILCIFNWYNPFAWLIRRSIRQNLEFIADDKVLRNGVDRKQYQYLLLKVIGVSQFSIANQFNFSSLKKRIAMMNKIRTARVHLVKFLFIIPLVLVLLLAFRSQQQADTIPDTVDLSKDTIPSKYKPLPKEFEEIRFTNKVTTKVINGKKVTVSEPETVIITLKDGKKETYGFNNPADLEAFEKKYKRPLDSILPPPPPPPPGAPGVSPKEDDEAPGIPLAPPTKDGVPTPPLPPPPAKPLDFPDPIKGVHVYEYTVTIKRKDGKTETYDMKVDKDLKDFEKKYGFPIDDLFPPGKPTPVKPSAKPKGSSPSNPVNPGGPSKLPLAPIDIDANPTNPVPSKQSIPNSPTPAKPGSPSKIAKPDNLPEGVTDGDLNKLKIDASLKGLGNPELATPNKIAIRGHNNNLEDILIIVDGKETKIKNINELTVDPNDIESITVLKGEADIKAYGEKGKNGVIIITTKKKAPAGTDTSKGRDLITSL